MKSERLDRRSFLRLGGMALAGTFLSRPAALQLMAAEGAAAARQRVVILGAGLSGLSAGLRLTEAGHDVVILEARQRPGGRVFTVREPFSDGLYAEAGAGRIPPIHHLTLEYVKRFGLELDPFYPDSGAKPFLWRGKRVVVPFGREPVTEDFRTDFTPQEREAGFGGLDGLYLEPLRQEFQALPFDAWPYPQLEKYGRISLKNYLKSRGASRDAIAVLCGGFEEDSVTDYVHDSISHAVPNLWKIRGGNDRLPRAMAHDLRTKIRYGAEVMRMEQRADGVKVIYQTAQGRREENGDFVICTLPFSVLRRVAVTPEWTPEKGRAIRQLYMGPVVRVFVQARERFWEKQGLNGFATADHPMEIWSPTYNQPGERGIVMSYLYERMAREYSALSSEKRVEKMLELFEQVHPGIKEQTEVTASFAWANEKYSLGAYAVTQPGDFERVVAHSGVPEGRIHFAGEHVSPWPGWMQGALHSGLRAAREVNGAAAMAGR